MRSRAERRLERVMLAYVEAPDLRLVYREVTPEMLVLARVRDQQADLVAQEQQDTPSDRRRQRAILRRRKDAEGRRRSTAPGMTVAQQDRETESRRQELASNGVIVPEDWRYTTYDAYLTLSYGADLRERGRLPEGWRWTSYEDYLALARGPKQRNRSLERSSAVEISVTSSDQGTPSRRRVRRIGRLSIITQASQS